MTEAYYNVKPVIRERDGSRFVSLFAGKTYRPAGYAVLVTEAYYIVKPVMQCS